VTFTPNLPTNGICGVYVWYAAAANRAKNVPLDIAYAGGATSTVGTNASTATG